jgi:hypothetical protein
MFFTLAICAATPGLCDALTDRARIADPSVMPVPGPVAIAWRSPDGRTALLRWGDGPPAGGPTAGSPPAGGPAGGLPAGTSASSQAGTIWAGEPTPGSGRAPLYARTAVTRVDPVYVAELPGAVVVADRAMWAAWTVSRLDDHDPLHVCALLNPGFPLGSGTPFAGVSALPGSTALYLADGEVRRMPAAVPAAPAPVTAATGTDRAGARAVAEALVAAVAPLRDSGRTVELSLTGGKDSRLIAAALVRAGVPVVARTHGFADHPDVVVAAEIARRLGIEHLVRTPAAPGHEVDVLGRIRATVLVADGMLSAFENVGRPDPAVARGADRVVTAGGHGGELLRGGYAETAAAAGTASAGGLRAALGPARRTARSAELLRRLTTRRLGLLRRAHARDYLVSLASWTPALTRHPLQALDDFYLVNRAGRWSAAARQAYLIRECLVQPLFDDSVVLSARTVPLADRVSGALSAAVLAELSPALTDIPLAGKPPVPRAQPPAGAAQGAAHAAFDWRRQYGETIAAFLRGYVLDLGTSGGLFDVASRPAVEKLLAGPQADRSSVWALATLACLLSGDYRRAREAAPRLTVT